MTINCTSSCIHEQEGNCMLTHVTTTSDSSHQGCAYFKDKKESHFKTSESKQHDLF